MIRQLKMDDTAIQLTDNISEADALLALQSKLKKNPGIQAAAKSHETPIYVTKVISANAFLVLTTHINPQRFHHGSFVFPLDKLIGTNKKGNSGINERS